MVDKDEHVADSQLSEGRSYTLEFVVRQFNPHYDRL